MLKIDQTEQIRRAFYIAGKSIRQITWEQHYGRPTVRAAILFKP